MDIKNRDEMTNIIRDLWPVLNKLKSYITWNFNCSMEYDILSSSIYSSICLIFTNLKIKEKLDREFNEDYNIINSNKEDKEYLNRIRRDYRSYTFNFEYNLELSTHENIINLKKFIKNNNLSN